MEVQNHSQSLILSSEEISDTSFDFPRVLMVKSSTWNIGRRSQISSQDFEMQCSGGVVSAEEVIPI